MWRPSLYLEWHSFAILEEMVQHLSNPIKSYKITFFCDLIILAVAVFVVVPSKFLYEI